MEALVSGGGLNFPGQMECGHRQTVGSGLLGERTEVPAGCWGAGGRVYSGTWFSSLAAAPETNQICVCSQDPKGPRP